jgi:hypothetical protein
MTRHSTLIFYIYKNIGFVIFFILLIIKMQGYPYRVDELTQVALSLFFLLIIAIFLCFFSI